jgi:hypothetical protein
MHRDLYGQVFWMYYYPPRAWSLSRLEFLTWYCVYLALISESPAIHLANLSAICFVTKKCVFLEEEAAGGCGHGACVKICLYAIYFV